MTENQEESSQVEQLKTHLSQNFGHLERVMLMGKIGTDDAQKLSSLIDSSAAIACADADPHFPQRVMKGEQTAKLLYEVALGKIINPTGEIRSYFGRAAQEYLNDNSGIINTNASEDLSGITFKGRITAALRNNSYEIQEDTSGDEKKYRVTDILPQKQ